MLEPHIITSLYKLPYHLVLDKSFLFFSQWTSFSYRARLLRHMGVWFILTVYFTTTYNPGCRNNAGQLADASEILAWPLNFGIRLPDWQVFLRARPKTDLYWKKYLVRLNFFFTANKLLTVLLVELIRLLFLNRSETCYKKNNKKSKKNFRWVNKTSCNT